MPIQNYIITGTFEWGTWNRLIITLCLKIALFTTQQLQHKIEVLETVANGIGSSAVFSLLHAISYARLAVCRFMA